MIQINDTLKPSDLNDKLTRFWELSAKKIKLIEKNYDEGKGSPVFTINGKYSTRGWTEWTQGFQYGSSILQYDATGEKSFLEKQYLLYQYSFFQYDKLPSQPRHEPED